MNTTAGRAYEVLVTMGELEAAQVVLDTMTDEELLAELENEAGE